MDDEKNFDAKKFSEDLKDQIHRDVHERIQARIRLKSGSVGGLVWGAVLALIGVALLLDHMGIIPWSVSSRFWPLLLVVFGLVSIARGRSFGWGGFLIILGGVLLGNALGYWHVRFEDLWPLILIAIGVVIMWHSFEGRRRWTGPFFATPSSGPGDPSNTVHVETVFGSSERRVTAKNFQGGKLKAVFGEVKLDLRSADIEGEEATIHADAVFGSVQIRVPESWHIITRGAGVFGSYADTTRLTGVEDATNPNRKRLIIKGGAVFGEVEIKN